MAENLSVTTGEFSAKKSYLQIVSLPRPATKTRVVVKACLPWQFGSRARSEWPVLLVTDAIMTKASGDCQNGKGRKGHVGDSHWEDAGLQAFKVEHPFAPPTNEARVDCPDTAGGPRTLISIIVPPLLSQLQATWRHESRQRIQAEECLTFLVTYYSIGLAQGRMFRGFAFDVPCHAICLQSYACGMAKICAHGRLCASPNLG